MSGKRLNHNDRKAIKSLRKATVRPYSTDTGDGGVFILREGTKNLNAIKHAAKAGR